MLRDRATCTCRMSVLRFLRLTIWLGILVGSLLPGAGAADTCEEWAAKVVSVQGTVEAQRVGEMQWQPVRLDDTYCPGDRIRVQEYSRAAIVLPNEAILRLDQKTTITFTGLEKGPISLLDLLSGAVHFFSRIPRSLKVLTPFVNAAVEGTEFFVRVEPNQTFLSVFEGRVVAANQAGSLALASGQAAVVLAAQAPTLRVMVRPRDAVQWALYYPPILDYRPADFQGETAWQAMVRRSIQFYRAGDLPMALASLAQAPDDMGDARFFTYRAGLLLSVGRVDEATVDIETALRLDPRHGHALALQSVIAVVQNKKDEALVLARKAVELEPLSSAARVALSYAQQAHFDLSGALTSLQEAVQLHPDNALVWARLAELWLSVGQLNTAVDAAQKAVALHPNLARTHTVLGFAFLTQTKTQKAKTAFARAIELEQAAPLPRLGLGLAKIRQGALQEGRREIEIAVSLDPDNALMRSYLGKAYYEEKRDKLASDQFATAKALDPFDPTPWFYDAIRKQTVNRPVESLQDLQKSMALNDNRAIYRSRLLLDEDLAVRSATLGRLYNELEFQQRALVEGWKSLNIDPANYSAHRFLADSYAVLPRHEIARVSELLQSQLLQPLNITPVQPQLAESELFILSGAGPAEPSLNEFNPLFNRNRFALLTSGIIGDNSTWGDEVVFSGVAGRLSYSVGQFHYETDGFRENNDLDQNIYNMFFQVSLSHTTSVQAEFRYKDREAGDLPLRFDPNNFLTTLRQEERTRSIRLGFRHAFTPRSDLIASFVYQQADFDTEVFPGFDFALDDDAFMAEIRQLFHSQRLQVTGGAGHFNADRKEVNHFPFPPFTLVEDSRLRHTNLYVYAQINYPKNVTWTIGGSADFIDGAIKDREQFNPKLGLTWNLLPTTTLRAAVFRTSQRTLTASQTIEPTQVAGFNQFFDDPESTDAWRYGIGIDQKFSTMVYGGAEFSRREMDVPFVDLALGGQVREAAWEEALGRAYLYWTPLSWLALSAEYQYEQFERADSFGVEQIAKIETHRVPLGIGFFHPLGFRARLQATYIAQEGKFEGPLGAIVSGDDRFWVVNAALGYRLPKRWGLVTLEVRNLFDQDFHFQDTDPANPVISPERLILARVTLAF
jgi:tetratricopeptide (TPR) repeat protein